MAVLVGAHDHVGEVRREDAAGDVERERKVAEAEPAVVVEEVAGVFDGVRDVDALRVVRQVHAARHLSAESGGVLFPSLVVVPRVEEAVGGAVQKFAPQFLVVDGEDFTVRDGDAVPAVLGDAIRNCGQGCPP